MSSCPKIVTCQSGNSQSKSKGESQGVPCRFISNWKVLPLMITLLMGNYSVIFALFAIVQVRDFPIHSKIVAISIKIKKKRVGHCRNAVPKSRSTLTTSSGSYWCNSDNKTHYETGIVRNSLENAGDSTNWRLDYYKFKHLSFAQVLKRTISNDGFSCQKMMVILELNLNCL